MANNDKENKIEKFTKEAIGKTLNQFNKEIGIADLVEVNKNQDRILNGILSQVNDENTEKTEKSNIITLDNSTDGIVELKEIQGDTNVNVSKIEEEMPITHDIGDKEGNVFSLNEVTQGAINIGEIQGNTLVNCNKDDKKELVLMKDLSTEGYSNVTLTEGVDGGLVDVALEGNTMVNVCDQKDPVAITKSYTVETGNHVALQGEYDGKCRPVVNGNTLVNLSEINTATLSPSNTMVSTGISMLKPSTTYTSILNIKTNTLSPGDGTSIVGALYVDNGNNQNKIELGYTGVVKSIFTTNSDISSYNFTTRVRLNSSPTEGSMEIEEILLEGDYTNKSLPGYFEGLKSSFEDKVVPENIATSLSSNNVGSYSDVSCYTNLSRTCNNGDIITISFEITNVGASSSIKVGYGRNNAIQILNTTKIGRYTVTYDGKGASGDKLYIFTDNADTFVINNVYVVEGDYTNYDFSDYDPTKAGKYKIDYVVTGKNKFDINKLIEACSNKSTINITINNNNSFTIQSTSPYVSNTLVDFGLDMSKQYSIKYDNPNNAFVITQVENGFNFYVNPKYDGTIVNLQIEEGSTVTTYEPYKEYKKTFYLNSPLLEGDTIEQQGDNVVHVHRYKEVVLNDSSIKEILHHDGSTYRVDTTISNFKLSGEIISILPTTPDRVIENRFDKAIGIWQRTIFITSTTFTTLDEFKTYLQSNPVPIVYQLATPQYEVISQNDTILCDSYVNGHLDVDSVVPIEKVWFNIWACGLKYLYPSTQYNVQFESDNVGKIDIMYLGNCNVANKDVVKGINKFMLTTPDTLSFTQLQIKGIGFNASNIVVTKATDQDFGYFEGMKSVGECEDLEVVSGNSDGTLSNTQTLTHEPLRAVGDVKDKYVLIDGKWYIERRCGSITLDGSGNILIRYKPEWSNDNTTAFEIIGNSYDTNSGLWNDRDEIKCNLLPNTSRSNIRDNTKNIIGIANYTVHLNFKVSSSTARNLDELNQWLSQNNMHILYKLKTPIYEPIDYNPFTVYSDTTHISNNSTIPCNMIIKNTGYNCLLKPSTTYTVSSNLGLNTVTTPSTLTEDCLRFYDTDTSSVTTMKDVTILEGDYTTGKPLPSHFSGIESAFEQEYDETVGKYKVKIRIQNEDASKENYIEFYINEPLRGIGDVKDKVYVKDDKVVVQRNCCSVTFNGSESWSSGGNYYYTKINNVNLNAIIPLCDKFVGILSPDGVTYPYVQYGGSPGSRNGNIIFGNTGKTYIEFKQWLQQNPTTVVYQLAEPTYEEVDYQEQRLFLNTYNNSTLFYESNIPVSNTSFKPLWEELVYLKNSTKYYIQFNSTASGTVVFNLGGTEVTKDIVEGYNNIAIDTPAETTNLLTIDGHGIKISEVVVSEVVCGGYYKGLQSCFEEHMENGKYRVLLRGIALDGSKVNGIKLYINEPLRGIGDVKDRLCIKDGKLMVERKCGEEIFDGSDDESWKFHKLEISGKYAYTSNKSLGKYKTNKDIISNIKSVNWIKNPWLITDNIISFLGSAGTIYSYTDYNNINDFKSNLNSNPMIVVYPKDTIIYEEATNEYGLPIVLDGYENGIVYIDSAVIPTTSIKYTSNNVLATTLSKAEEQNNSTQDDINVNVVTYMMDIDMLLTEMEMSNDISVMAVRRDSSNENMLDRMSDEDKKVYRDNTVVMLEKMITANVLEKEDIEGRINMYYNKNRISKEQYKYLKSLL